MAAMLLLGQIQSVSAWADDKVTRQCAPEEVQALFNENMRDVRIDANRVLEHLKGYGRCAVVFVYEGSIGRDWRTLELILRGRQVTIDTVGGDAPSGCVRDASLAYPDEPPTVFCYEP